MDLDPTQQQLSVHSQAEEEVSELSDSSVMECGPLTTQDKRNVRDLVDAYARFWTGVSSSEALLSKAFNQSEVYPSYPCLLCKA